MRPFHTQAPSECPSVKREETEKGGGTWQLGVRCQKTGDMHEKGEREGERGRRKGARQRRNQKGGRQLWPSEGARERRRGRDAGTAAPSQDAWAPRREGGGRRARTCGEVDVGEQDDVGGDQGDELCHADLLLEVHVHEVVLAQAAVHRGVELLQTGPQAAQEPAGERDGSLNLHVTPRRWEASRR